MGVIIRKKIDAVGSFDQSVRISCHYEKKLHAHATYTQVATFIGLVLETGATGH